LGNITILGKSLNNRSNFEVFELKNLPGAATAASKIVEAFQTIDQPERRQVAVCQGIRRSGVCNRNFTNQNGGFIWVLVGGFNPSEKY
jgi:rhodanese-related sulfurtransferase